MSHTLTVESRLPVTHIGRPSSILRQRNVDRCPRRVCMHFLIGLASGHETHTREWKNLPSLDVPYSEGFIATPTHCQIFSETRPSQGRTTHVTRLHLFRLSPRSRRTAACSCAWSSRRISIPRNESHPRQDPKLRTTTFGVIKRRSTSLVRVFHPHAYAHGAGRTCLGIEVRRGFVVRIGYWVLCDQAQCPNTSFVSDQMPFQASGGNVEDVYPGIGHSNSDVTFVHTQRSDRSFIRWNMIRQHVPTMQPV